MELVEARLKEMHIELRDVIGEPIALTCYHKSTKWSGVIKLHLKTPEIDGIGLLQGLRPFILKLGEDKYKRGKVCKTYDALALNNLLSVKITSETLEFKDWYELFEKILDCSLFTRASSEDERKPNHLQSQDLRREISRPITCIKR
jgi:hypothetical protein